MKVLFAIVALFAFFYQIDGMKVLGVLPFESSSHFAIGNSIVEALHSAGHEVTSFSPYPQKKSVENFRTIDMSDSTNKPGILSYLLN